MIIKRIISDKAPALAEMSFSFGAMIGPCLGGGLTDWHGFDFTINVMVVSSAFFGIIYCFTAVFLNK